MPSAAAPFTPRKLNVFVTKDTEATGVNVIREVVCSPGHFLKGAVNLSLENQINWYYA